ncbi:putative DNA-binding protein [Oscillibacter valericigenes Sjm18-20]|nr:putative DNA-binding protein [Oscillibacter valericigenes Sjm18-20]
MSEADRRIANYILENLSAVGLQTATTRSMTVGVSDTSVIRFVRELGFRGRAEFRSEMSNPMAW